MSSSASPIVAIPAHDEAERLGQILASLAAQQGFGRGRRLPVLVLANNCRDDTVEIAKRFAASPEGASLHLDVHTVELAPAKAHVGTARRLAMDGAAERVGSTGILLTTDADARLPPDWVAANVAALDSAEIVGGRLVIDAATLSPELEALHRDVERYWSSVRAIEERLDPQPHDPAPRHGDHTGASLALRVETYRDVGGLPPLPRGEDNALVARVVEAGGRLRHDPHVSVRVSDRLVGRAGGGMAAEMVRRQAVLADGEVYLLPEPAHWERLIDRRAKLRAAWAHGQEQEKGRGQGQEQGQAHDAAVAALAAFGLPTEEIAAVAPRDCPNAIAFVERSHRHLHARDEPARLMTLTQALAEFAAAAGVR